MRSSRFVIAGLIVLLGVLGGFLLWDGDPVPVPEGSGSRKPPAASPREKQPVRPEKSRPPVGGSLIPQSAPPAEDGPGSAESAREDSLPPEDRKIVDSIQSALDDDDLKGVAATLKAAAASTNAAVRAKAVEALQWFGQEALPELTTFMADADDDVRTAAIDAWTMGVSQMVANDEKAQTVRRGLSVVTDKEQLEAMVMQVDDLTDIQKINVLTQVIGGENKTAAEVAREHYKFWTEEDYVDLETAQKWLDAKAAESAEAE